MSTPQKEQYEQLYNATVDGNTELLSQLIAAGIDVNTTYDNGSTPLCMAVFFNHPECIKQLLAAPGINVNQTDTAGRTPL